MVIRPGRFAVLAVALLTASAALPATAANGQERLSIFVPPVLRRSVRRDPLHRVRHSAHPRQELRGPRLRHRLGAGRRPGVQPRRRVRDRTRRTLPLLRSLTRHPLGSAVLGGQNLSSDLYFRGARATGTVEKLLSAEPAPRGPSRDSKDLMRGWAAGYNAWLAQNRITDPACRGAFWVRPVTAVDVAARTFALAVLGGQGRAVDGITACAAARDDRRAYRRRHTRPTECRARRPSLLDTADMGLQCAAFSGATTANGRGLLLATRTIRCRAAVVSGSRSRRSPES